MNAGTPGHACDIAVVVPVYNRPGLLLETLDSVLAQTVLPTMVVVVDDGSTDDVETPFRAWRKARQPAFEIEFLRQPNQGASEARNVGAARIGEVELIHFLDSDDRLPEDFYERLGALWSEQPDAVAVSCDRLHDYGAGIPSKREPLETLARDPVEWLLRHGGGIGSCSLLRRDLVSNLGGYPRQIPTGHDMHLFLRLARMGSWLYSPGEPVAFRRGESAHKEEEGQLHRRYPNFHEIWADVCEDFLKAAEVTRDEVFEWRKILARRWEKAGEQLAENGESSAARRCFRRSMNWRFRPRVVLKMLTAKKAGSQDVGV